jgi:PAS domain S-box-containing protein
VADRSHHDTSYHALLAREARFLNLLDAATDRILLSRRGVMTDVSEPLLEHSGYTRDELIGRSLTEFVAEEFRGIVRQAREALRGSQERLQLALQATGLGPWD